MLCVNCLHSQLDNMNTITLPALPILPALQLNVHVAYAAYETCTTQHT